MFACTIFLRDMKDLKIGSMQTYIHEVEFRVLCKSSGPQCKIAHYHSFYFDNGTNCAEQKGFLKQVRRDLGYCDTLCNNLITGIRANWQTKLRNLCSHR